MKRNGDTADVDDHPNVAHQLPESNELGIHAVWQTSWRLRHDLAEPEAPNDSPDDEERNEKKPNSHKAKL